ncbi:nitroreductase family protein [Salarchaeum sp. JOR-1]|uniref:nitroreductase family protein n=1 Tax=Salarchaeum sp. JOR-1 TaxID=2599399 RepID=UPI0011988DC2|nr:nitroreductase family protein [Salarchaeum sp. JOR-1]QDX39726.1 nitroreductase family protein [Salarchaeum sp. JOR-1]
MQEVEAERSLREAVAANRTPTRDVDPLFVNRWSGYAMTGEPVPEEDYLPVFEAARWAPSSRNTQPWRFAYADRRDDEWETFVSLPNDWNRQWAANAAALVVLFSETTDEKGRDLASHSFDAGAAWENLALEATRRGLVAHPMGGFDHDAAAEKLNAPDDYDAEVMIAIGEPAPTETLPEDIQDGDEPNGRKPLDEIVTRGGF